MPTLISSRNAVVALKPAPMSTTPFRIRVKQERRGGIETGFVYFDTAGTHLKQERRGGIETTTQVLTRILLMWEAGTPWWH